MKKVIKKMLTELYNLRQKRIAERIEMKNLTSKKELIKKISLNNEQKKAIDDIWIKNYGKKIPYDWHRLYTSYTGKFDSKYFPEILFKTELLDKLNPRPKNKYLCDKILTEHFFQGLKDIKTVKNYIYNCNGYFYDDERNYKL